MMEWDRWTTPWFPLSSDANKNVWTTPKEQDSLLANVTAASLPVTAQPHLDKIRILSHKNHYCLLSTNSGAKQWFFKPSSQANAVSLNCNKLPSALSLRCPLVPHGVVSSSLPQSKKSHAHFGRTYIKVGQYRRLWALRKDDMQIHVMLHIKKERKKKTSLCSTTTGMLLTVLGRRVSSPGWLRTPAFSITKDVLYKL